jgi:galactose mutarotase-like enzyme
MARNTWILTDVERDVYVPELCLRPEDVGGSATGYQVHKRTLRGGLRDGVDVVELTAGELSLCIVPDRGMGIWRGSYGDVQLGWRSPVQGPVNPRYVSVAEDNGLGWLQGFDEWLCRCGLECNGPPERDSAGQLQATLHGTIANRPAHHVAVTVDGDAGEISVTGIVDEGRLFGNLLRLKSTVIVRMGESKFRIIDEITNRGAQPAELELLYHINFGPPLVGPGARLIAPVKTLAPRDDAARPDVPTWDTCHAEEAGAAEAVHYFDLAADESGQTGVMLQSASADRSVSLWFNQRQLPRFVFWKSRRPDAYVTGLEPAINFPNVKSFEKAQGRVAMLAPGETRTYELDFAIHAGRESVNTAAASIAKLQQGIAPQILASPKAGWSPGA